MESGRFFKRFSPAHRVFMTSPSLKRNRPLSPHLHVYKPQITSVLSITHRLSGVLLSLGALGIAAWLWSVAYSPKLYACLHTLFSYELGPVNPGHLVLMAWSFCFYYHLANGIRHLFWDIGKGFDLKNLTRSGWFVLVFSLAATLFTWLVIYGKIDLYAS